MSQTPEERRAKAAKRQADRKARETAAGRVRRAYFATEAEHNALASHLEALRSSRRKGDILVADPGDVLPEFRAVVLTPAVCRTCGEDMIGDGFNTAIRCPGAEVNYAEPDAGPFHCTERYPVDCKAQRDALAAAVLRIEPVPLKSGGFACALAIGVDTWANLKAAALAAID